MTITTTKSTDVLEGNGVTTSFPFAVKFLDNDDVTVTVVDSDGAETLLSEGVGSTEYSLTGAGNAGGGTVVYPASGGSPLPSGSKLVIQRSLEIVQDLDLTNQSGFFLETIEDTFDRSVMYIQQVKGNLSSPLSRNLSGDFFDAEDIKIINLGAPTSANDAARKADLDAMSAAVTASQNAAASSASAAASSASAASDSADDAAASAAVAASFEFDGITDNATNTQMTITNAEVVLGGNLRLDTQDTPIIEVRSNVKEWAGGEDLGGVDWYNYDGSGVGAGVVGSLHIESVGSTIRPISDFVFKNADSSGTLLEVLRISGATKDATFNGSIDASVGGVYLGGSVAANLLEDYEEGTFTIVVSDAESGGNTGTFSSSVANYTKVGNKVTIIFSVININTAGMTAGNTLKLQGMPFTSNNTSGSYSIGVAVGQNITGLTNLTTSTAITIRDGTSACQLPEILISEISSGSGDVYGSLTYLTA